MPVNNILPARAIYLLPFLEEFHERHPGIKVIVANAPTPETLQLLRAGKIDFGVVSTPFEQDPGIRMEQVREIEDMFVAGRRFLPYKNKMLDFAPALSGTGSPQAGRWRAHLRPL